MTSPTHGKRQSEKTADDQHRPAKVSRVQEEATITTPIMGCNSPEISYTSMESDTEPPASPVRMDWRTDPGHSLSDWTIEVVVASEDAILERTTKHYHVHRSILILESAYFRNFFAENPNATTMMMTVPTAEDEDDSPSMTQIELHEKAARFFPDLLDYMYGQALQFTTENAAVFHFFGNYFGMRRLRWDAKSVWQKDMSAATVATYYRDSIVFGDSKVLMAVQQACCRDDILLSFQSDSDILKVPDPRLLVYVVRHTDPRHSEHLSGLVASFCSEHKVDSETFVDLTCPEHLPKIAFSVTLILLDLERTILLVDNDHNTALLSSLQDRCIAALEQRWFDMELDQEDFATFLSQQSPSFVAELFQRTLHVAQAWHKSSASTRQQPHGSPLLVVSPSQRDDAMTTDNANASSGNHHCESGERECNLHRNNDDEDDDESLMESAADTGGDGRGSMVDSDTEDESRLPKEVVQKCSVSSKRDELLSGDDN